MVKQDQDPSSGAPSEEHHFAVQTFTARYDPIEDRVCLNAVDVDGGKQAIYLTRRLMDQIIPVVVKHLEEKTPKGVPSDVAQSMNQERVREARKTALPAEPVQVDLETPRWLCTTVQMSKRAAGLAITLADDTACTAQISLTDLHIRTVLDIFRTSYVKAGWDLRVFPDWLVSGQAAIGPRALIRLN